MVFVLSFDLTSVRLVLPGAYEMGIHVETAGSGMVLQRTRKPCIIDLKFHELR